MERMFVNNIFSKDSSDFSPGLNKELTVVEVRVIPPNIGSISKKTIFLKVFTNWKRKNYQHKEVSF